MVAVLREPILPQLQRFFRAAQAGSRSHHGFPVHDPQAYINQYEDWLRLDGPRRKDFGQYYTPPDMAGHLSQSFLAHYPPGPVIDPACGAGGLLIPVIRRRGWQAVYGADIDPVAVEVARMVAWLAAPSPPPWEALADQFSAQDSLLTPFPAAWPGAFAGVITNPPFRNAIRSPLPAEQRAAIRTRLSAWRGAADLAYAFLALAEDLLSPNGVAGFVLPRAALANRAAAPILARFEVLAATEWGCSDAFAEATVSVALLTLRRQASTTTSEALLPTLADRFEIAAGMTVAEAYDLIPFLREDANARDRRLLTTGLIEPNESQWGYLECRYLKGRWRHPAVDAESQTPPWLQRRLDRATRPKVVLAGLSRRLEAIADLNGVWLPAVGTWCITHPQDDPREIHRLAEGLNHPAASDEFRRQLGPTALSGGNITVTRPFLGSLSLELLGLS